MAFDGACGHEEVLLIDGVCFSSESVRDHQMRTFWFFVLTASSCQIARSRKKTIGKALLWLRNNNLQRKCMGAKVRRTGQAIHEECVDSAHRSSLIREALVRLVIYGA